MHPLLFPLGSTKRWTSFLKAELEWDRSQINYAENLLSKNRIPLWTGSEIAHYLGLTEKLVNFIRLRPDRFYRSFSIPKKNSSLRTIQAPRLYLKVIQHYILDCILNTGDISQHSFGFVKGKTAATGATCHAGCNYLWNIDLKDFFPSIPRYKIKAAFIKLEYSKEAAEWLSAICSLNGSLPQGAPTSPALSNIIFKEVDDLIENASRAHNIRYSRYADDLSFSSNVPIDNNFRGFIKELIEIEGYIINNSKERLMGPKCRREVTGLTVNEIVSIPRAKRRLLRAKFHKVSLNPALFSSQRAELGGFASWVHQHHPNVGEAYLKIVDKIPSSAEGSQREP